MATVARVDTVREVDHTIGVRLGKQESGSRTRWE